jgi:hypothetical protein
MKERDLVFFKHDLWGYHRHKPSIPRRVKFQIACLTNAQGLEVMPHLPCVLLTKNNPNDINYKMFFTTHHFKCVPYLEILQHCHNSKLSYFRFQPIALEKDHKAYKAFTKKGVIIDLLIW